eukprot:TRINITY_DN42417_c0_g5_i1.p1 TRINITY_DN42417_c0_g5~~TRINITY_DN42417_c0_g5_i1.p1  ORF type:complete len:171 (+),score=2.74 TRINITY_DN42417_c0_g5_i1:37-549(+)
MMLKEVESCVSSAAMVWDLRDGPMKMDYSRFDPEGRKRAIPERCTQGLRECRASRHKSPAVQKAWAALDAKRGQSVPSAHRRTNPFSQRCERASSCAAARGNKKERRVHFEDQPAQAPAPRIGFRPPVPTAPKPVDRFVRYRHLFLGPAGETDTGVRATEGSDGVVASTC